MPSVFIYEEMVARHREGDPESSMLVEGRAMLNAVAEDFTRAGYTLLDDHINADLTLLIAPECTLFGLITAYLEEGCRLLNCDAAAVDMTADKLTVSEYWLARGVRTPKTMLSRLWWPEVFPVMVKPRDGAGSTDVLILHSIEEWRESNVAHRSRFIVQEYVPGRAASIAFLVGERSTVVMSPTFQRLSDDGLLHYLGGCLPMHAELFDRAVKLGYQAIDSIVGLKGYIGVDLVLGEAADGSQDYAIEINPRLTTSYVGLRALADFNLAQAMIDVVEGKPVDYIRWKPGRVRFWPDGRVEHDPTPGAFWE